MTQSLRIVAATARGFDATYTSYVEQPAHIGEILAVREGVNTIFAVVTSAASGPEDPTRPLPPRGAPGQTAAAYMDSNPEVRLLLSTRLTAVTAGYLAGAAVRPVLPPSPPPLLAEAAPATAEEVRRLTSDGAFLALLVAAPGCDDAILAATLRAAVTAHEAAGHDFLVRAGKELARLLKAEPSRLTTILRSVAQ